MNNKKGAIHKMPADLQKAIISQPKVKTLWEDITSLARNEFICWVEDAKKEETRARRIRRTCEELLEGKRRPCCWPGCPHRLKNNI
ncbi:MAG: YdeI/OmpD-associated family protein [Patescibacteria group bacterium]|jgi:uncharacterized protein YdeI (YjbR/CyaY-like superfamily)